MASFDRERGQLVLRIVYDGLGGAGKTTNLRALQDAFALARRGDVVTPAATTSGRTLYFDWLILDCGWLDERPLRCEVISVPGQFAFSDRRFHLLRSPDAIVEVCDASPAALALSKLGLRYLRAALDATAQPDIPLLIQANKQDASDALAPAALGAALDLAAEVPIVGAAARSGDGVRETFIRALGMARDRLRRQLEATPVDALPEPIDGPAALLAALEASDGEGGARVLDQLLDLP